MYACQIYVAAQRSLPGLDANIAAGKFGDLKVGPIPLEVQVSVLGFVGSATK